VQRNAAPALDNAATIADPIVRTQKTNKILKAVDKVIDQQLTPDMLDKGGVKLFGKSIIPGSAFSKLGDGAVKAMAAAPGGELAIKSAVRFYDWSAPKVASLFSPFSKLHGLPDNMKQAAVKIHRDAQATHQAIATSLSKEWAPLKVEFDRALKSDPDLGKKFYDIREGTGSHVLTPDQQSLYDRTAALYDRTEQALVQVGALDLEDLLRGVGYFKHVYKNGKDVPAIAEAAARRSGSGASLPRFTKERPFKTYKDAVETSTEINRADPRYPVLEPSYDVMNGLAIHIDEVASAVSKKQWVDDAVGIFGELVPEFDIVKHFDLAPVATTLSAREGAALAKFFSRDIEAVLQSRGKLTPYLNRNGSRLVNALGPDGKREFFRELFSRVNSPSQFAEVAKTFRSRYGQFFPTPIPQGPPLEGFVRRTGGLWGDKVVDIPKHIADDIENFSSVMFRTQDLMPGVKQMVEGYDWLNKWFKIGAYPFWPSSMVRDSYNNLMMSFLDIGVGSVKNPMNALRVIRGKGKIVIGGVEYDAKLLKQQFADLGILDPGGRTFTQIDETEKIYRLPTGLEKALGARAHIDNFSRAQLALNHMGRGMDIRNAADRVKETLFAYNELSPVERSVFRRAIPFYTFPRKAIAFHAKMLKEKPGIVGAEVKPFRGRESENEQMTSWEGDAFKVRLDRDGKTVTVLTGIDLPIKTLDTLWKGSFTKTGRQQIGMVSPFMKAVPELLLNRSSFTNRDLDRQSFYLAGKFLDGIDAPELKNWVGYKKETDAAGRPKYTFDGHKVYVGFQMWALSRVLSTSERQFREYLQDGDYAAALLDLVTGVRLKELNLDEQKKMMLEERYRQLNDAAVRRGTRQRIGITTKPKGEVEYQ
jgi:hypothetical protein